MKGLGLGVVIGLLGWGIAAYVWAQPVLLTITCRTTTNDPFLVYRGDFRRGTFTWYWPNDDLLLVTGHCEVKW